MKNKNRDDDNEHLNAMLAALRGEAPPKEASKAEVALKQKAKKKKRKRQGSC